VCHVDDAPGNLLLSDLTWRLVPEVDVEPRYLAYSLSSPGTRRTLMAVASGTSGSMKKLNQQKVRLVEVPFPDRELQVAAADRLDAAKKTVMALRRHLESGKGTRRALIASLLSGEQQIASDYDRYLSGLKETG
jgi:type I restriction enzyme S subunit